MAGKLHAGARAGTPLRCPRGPGSLQGAHTQPTPRDRPRQGTSLDLFPFSRARGGAFRPERLALPGGDCGTRAERSGAGRRGPHLAESRSGRGRAAARGMPPDGSRGSVRPGPPAAPPVRAAITGSRRAFSQARAPRPFCLRPRSRLRSAWGGGTRFPSRDGPELRELRAETVNEPRGAAPPTQRRPGSSGDPAVTAPSPDPTPQ